MVHSQFVKMVFPCGNEVFFMVHSWGNHLFGALKTRKQLKTRNQSSRSQQPGPLSGLGDASAESGRQGRMPCPQIQKGRDLV